jgi:hypothetical protein
MTEANRPGPALRDNPEEQYRLLTENVKDFAIFLLDKGGNCPFPGKPNYRLTDRSTL